MMAPSVLSDFRRRREVWNPKVPGFLCRASSGLSTKGLGLRNSGSSGSVHFKFRPRRRNQLIACFATVVFALAGIASLTAPVASAFTIYSYSSTPSTTQAGGHPNININFEIEDYSDDSGHPNPKLPCGCNNAKNLDIYLPAGVIGNPHATPKCSNADFARETCPADSQIGVAHPTVDLNGYFTFGPFTDPVYNLEPRPNQAGLIGWLTPLFNTPVYHVISARTATDYGLDVLTDGVEQILPIVKFNEELWGVPAEPIHDAERFGPNYTPGYPSNSPPIPFLQNPTSCTGPLSSTLDALSYDGTSGEATAEWPATTGCDQLSFNPSLSAQPTTTETDSPSGLEVDLSVPQELSPTTPSPSEIRANTVTLPEGLTINSSAANGKTSCSEAQAGVGSFASTEESQCPEYSRIGTVSLESSALPGTLPGSIYLAEPKPGDTYRIFVTANGFATHIKLTGDVRPDPETGRLTVSFPELPQSPLTEINLHFFGAEGGLLATPTRCETYAVNSTFKAWDGSLPEQSSTQLFSLDSGPGGSQCPAAARPFNPAFTAASASNTAGAHTPFSIELTRSDGSQDLSGLTVTTPPGLLASLAGIPYCSSAALQAAAEPSYSGLQEEASPSCPAASQIGISQSGAGAGDHPVYLPGKVYLAGPYKGAPLSLAVITPTVSGPYDLGNVVVRAALNVNPETVQITAVSDPLPQILDGIPLRLRQILLELNRPDFTLNPTDCNPLSVDATASGDEGTQAHLAAPFQVSNCAHLPFAPKLALRLSGSTKQAGNPALAATLTARPGEASISRTQVTLPHTEFVDNAHIKSPCTRVEFAAGHTPGEQCPPGSVLGSARAESPLLAEPLQGPIYLRSTGRAGLPDVVAALNGQIDIALVGHVDSVHGRLRTTFETVPDAPVSKVLLSFDGGHRGIIENSPGVCSHSLRVTADITGQNGKTANQTPILQTPCKRPKSQKKTGAH